MQPTLIKESSSAFMEWRWEGGDRCGDVLRPRRLAMFVCDFSCYRGILLRSCEEVSEESRKWSVFNGSWIGFGTARVA